jgi:hypothetical protein
MLSMLILVLLAQVLAQAVAWGPLFHYDVACSSTNVSSPSTCLCDGAHTELFWGAELPDAGFFGSSAYVMSSKCPAQVAALHDPVFAGFMLAISPEFRSATFDAVAFAKGFGSHVLSDPVGFAFPRGFFVASANFTVNSGIDWLFTWPQMLAIDAVVATSFVQCGGAAVPRAAMSDEAAAFVAAATARYQTVIPAGSFPVLAVADVLTCAASWQLHLQAVRQVTAATAADAALSRLHAFDPYQSATAAQTLTALTQQRACAMASVASWVGDISAGVNPETAVNNALQHVQSLYAAGSCAPQT